MLTTAWVERNASTFDVMHVHFGFDAVEPEDLERVVATLRRHGKPLVVTVHDLRNPHHATAQLHDAQLGVLVTAADALITLTPGAAATIRARWGREATVLPHPHVVPDEWLGRPRPRRDEFVVGLHAKSLRANMDPLPLVRGAHRSPARYAGCPAARRRAHRRHDRRLRPPRPEPLPVASPPWPARDWSTSRCTTTSRTPELWEYLHGLDVSVLPYQFGTHSGWLEACHDLGTWVAAPDCGFYAEQRPCLTYAATGPLRTTSLVQAVRTAHARWSAGEAAPRARRAARHTERDLLARAHEDIYGAVLERRLACTS